MEQPAAGRPALRRSLSLRAAPIRFAALACAAVAADVAFDPAHRHVPLCPLHAATGLWCPLCGGLRAVAALARGHLVAAARDNVLVLAAIPVVAAMWVAWLAAPRVAAAGTTRTAPSAPTRPGESGARIAWPVSTVVRAAAVARRGRRTGTIVAVVLAVVFTAVRNLPGMSALHP